MAKKSKKTASGHAAHNEPSAIIQLGVIVIIIAAMFLVAYTVKVYR